MFGANFMIIGASVVGQFGAYLLLLGARCFIIFGAFCSMVFAEPVHVVI